MGIGPHALADLIRANSRGVRFDSVLMLGRQILSMGMGEALGMLEARKVPRAADVEETTVRGYTEWIFRALGATRVDSMDVSDYEGATVLHDLNTPIPPELEGQYDLVYDGGTLEHVFNFPTAIWNAMRLCRVGGRLVIHNAANNWCGHGFYQFSPGLFHDLFTSENRYQIEQFELVEWILGGRRYRVNRPEKQGKRVSLNNDCPVCLLVWARRLEGPMPSFPRVHQDQYEVLWKDAPRAENPGRTSIVTPSYSFGTRLRGYLHRLAQSAIPGLYRAYLRRTSLRRCRSLSFENQPAIYHRLIDDP